VFGSARCSLEQRLEDGVLQRFGRARGVEHFLERLLDPLALHDLAQRQVGYGPVEAGGRDLSRLQVPLDRGGGRQVGGLVTDCVLQPVAPAVVADDGDRVVDVGVPVGVEAETLRSVLEQTYRDFELVVLDNASTDDTSRIASSFADPRLRLVTNPSTLPQPENWRTAVQLCRAPLVKLVCADDLLHPRCLELQVAAMNADPGLAIVAARRHMIDESSRVLVPRRGLRGLTGVRSGIEVARKVIRSGANPIGEPGGVLFRRADYFSVGAWHADRRWAMDLDLWLRLLQCGDFLGQPETLAAFRVGRHSLSADNEAAIYATQKAIMAQAAATPTFGCGGVIVWWGTCSRRQGVCGGPSCSRWHDGRAATTIRSSAPARRHLLTPPSSRGRGAAAA
jgi:glycosyl transferase family 2